MVFETESHQNIGVSTRDHQRPSIIHKGTGAIVHGESVPRLDVAPEGPIVLVPRVPAWPSDPII